MWCPRATVDLTQLNHEQAYDASLSTTDACKIVRVGNQSLYFWAYAHGNVLYVSGWRSVNPEHANSLADVGRVAKGHLVLEILSMIILSEAPQQMENWVSGYRKDFRQEPRPSPIITVGVELWRMIAEIFTQWKLPRTIKLEAREFTGFLTTYVSTSVALFFSILLIQVLGMTSC